MSNGADSQALPTFEDMMNIFAHLDEVAAVPSRTRSKEYTKPVSHSNGEVLHSASNKFDTNVCIELNQELCNSRKGINVNLQPALQAQNLPETASRPFPARLFCENFALKNTTIVSTKAKPAVDLEEDSHERLPTCEEMLCIFANLECSDSCYDEGRGQENEMKMQQDKLNTLDMGKKNFHDDCVSLQSALDGGETPCSVTTLDLVCK